ncbi:MAG TPA: carbamoyltransferase C-terminal domain-containing protein [Vicinamibacterales bacterium]|nr:carbamoyltransferase C-terminal domain-containing protein [Vicinamibacterales bacterium]
MNRAHVVIGVGGIIGHDANAAVLVDGRLIAASQEERYSRKKHDEAFPERAINECLGFAGLSLSDVDVCVLADKPLQEWLSSRSERPSNWVTWLLGRVVPPNSFTTVARARALMPRATIGYSWHHMAHAAMAFATSPYERAAFLCVDGAGDDVNATIGIADAHDTRILYELPYQSGLGFLYSLVTDYLGLSFGAEYRVMGLAPYGTPVFMDKLRSFSRTDADGALRFNLHPPLQWPALRRSLARHLGLPERSKGEPLTDDHANVAASMQALFEEQLFRMAAFAKRVTGERYLLFCGGCAQNCVAAGKLRGLGIFDGVFTAPAAADMGTGIGAALLHQQHSGAAGDGKVDVAGMMLGSKPGAVPQDALPHELSYAGDVFTAAAGLLAEGNIVGWVRGRMELGARALGGRSILADARIDGMQSTLNDKIKFRESFRPFAPAILMEDCGAWFDSTEPSDYMQATAWLKPEHRYAASPGATTWRERLAQPRCAFSSVVHVDYSSRLQTVRRQTHPDLHRLLTEFKTITGCPLLINTSFNVSGEPIVRTAEEAWQCFRHTRMDYLVVDDRIFRHPHDTTLEENLAWREQFAEFA